ncbi:MAG: helix-turn-helix transcriptional regulator [Myxococcales bacterium]|nr:helix-turn-helix transcriptional regulator [Myxococcales bacterium]
MHLATRNRIVRAAATLESLDKVGEALLPALATATHASLVFAYRGLPDGQGVRAYLPADTPDLVTDYFREYAHDCPLHRVKEKVGGAVVPTTALYGLKALKKTRVYNELWRPWGLDHHLALRFDDPRRSAQSELNVLGLMINRDVRRGEYSDEELRRMSGLSAQLEGALARAARLDLLESRVAALEAALQEPPGQAKVVLDADAQVLHASTSPDAAAVVARLRARHHPVRQAARRLLSRRDDEPLALEQVVEGAPGERWRASLALREDGWRGRPLVVVSLVAVGTPPGWSSLGLTRSEQAVLQALVAGQSNAEIGRSLFISPETVRTHLTRIYKKLGVRSRLEAVVKARLRGSA